jgi:hypothetical protein
VHEPPFGAVAGRRRRPPEDGDGGLRGGAKGGAGAPAAVSPPSCPRGGHSGEGELRVKNSSQGIQFQNA